MFAQILWWAGYVLESLLLLRAVRGGFFKHYPIFYCYLIYVLVQSLLGYGIYLEWPQLYGSVYWYSQFVSVAVGYCVIWEIFSQTLVSYPGAARAARTLLLTVFVLVFIKVFANRLSGLVWSMPRTTAELERNFRTVQAILLVSVVGLLAYYSISIGRNLKGMILGYGFYVGSSVISLSLRSPLGDPSQWWWQYVQPIAYLFALLIWCSALWSYQPNPDPGAEMGIERDYELLAARTTKLLTRLRQYLLWAVRS